MLIFKLSTFNKHYVKYHNRPRKTHRLRVSHQRTKPPIVGSTGAAVADGFGCISRIPRDSSFPSASINTSTATHPSGIPVSTRISFVGMPKHRHSSIRSFNAIRTGEEAIHRGVNIRTSRTPPPERCRRLLSPKDKSLFNRISSLSITRIVPAPYLFFPRADLAITLSLFRM